jgi:hypothetical protein
MSQTTGKTSTYIRNANVKESTQIQTGFKKTRFLHQATQGNTLIQLTSLTTPSGAVNYAAPNISELSQTNLLQWSSNLTLTSSLRGVLIQNISYVITGAQTIKLLFEAADAEIFEGVIDHQARTGLTMVDATPLVASGTLAAGQTDFNVGTPFKVGEYASQRHGVVLVYLDGQLMYRNTGNQVPGPGVEGDYQEVNAGGGLGVLIRFNTPDLINDRAVSVISVGSLVEKPNGSQLAVQESLQGQIDAMVPTLAALSGQPTTAFQGTPNNTDLKAFGDRVLSAEQTISNHETRVTNLESFPVAPFTLTSGTKTPVASARWALLTGNSFTLTPGTWIVNARAFAFNSGSNPNYSRVHCTISTVNGDDTATFPNFSSPNVTVYGPVDNVQDMPTSNDSPDWMTRVESVLMVVTANTTIFANVYVEVGTPTNSRLLTNLWG